jgi:phospholipid N-methyltransferase
MSILSFIKQYITRPRTVGAILPSSEFLAKKMITNIDFTNAHCIVEYGPGTGVFTEKILEKKATQTLLLLFETNEEFYTILKTKYKSLPNLHVINDSAENVGKHLNTHNIQTADYIVSGLPFASLPQEVSSSILSETKKHLEGKGSFITFQYTLLKKDFIGKYFKQIDISREVRNVPPAYVLCCKN